MVKSKLQSMAMFCKKHGIPYVDTVIAGMEASGVPALIEGLISRNLAKRNWTHVIFLRYAGRAWVFDIPIMGIIDEPFVSGIPEIFEHNVSLTQLRTIKQVGVPVLFSGARTKPKEFNTGVYIKLELLRLADGGAWYKDIASGLQGWFCPALYKFFATAPATMHICVRV